MNGCPFWYERGLIGAVLTLLLRIGEVFIVGCMTPPSLPCVGLVGVMVFLVFVGLGLVSVVFGLAFPWFEV